MSSPPKSSLVERLVQDRLRSGDLEASAAKLLHLGGGMPDASEIVATASGNISGSTSGIAVEDPGGPRSAMNGGAGAEPREIDALTIDAMRVTPATTSLVAEHPLDSGSDDRFRGGPMQGGVAPMALELRPLAEPAPPPVPATSFPLPGLAPSALVPPPATALPVSAKPSLALLDPAPPPAPTLAPVAEPRFPAVAAEPREIERPDLVQGPPTIDAVALERGGMVDWSRTRSRISEEFRLVQRQILRAAFGPGAEPGFSNLLMVTSARPGEGKSFTSVNLAGSIARQGDHHVLLVDADSKRDSFCYALGLAEMRGLLDLVANPKLDPSPLIVKTPIDRLSILPVGRERERSAELFSTKEMTRLIQSLGRRYADRLLVLDAPPCLSTSDPAVLAPVVGQILFVVEADRTQRDEVEASLDLIQACPNITLVLNKQQISSRYTFGAYSSYYSS
jgi:protein-tyrosine kinase